MELTTHTAKGVEKTARYGWITKDEPGSLQFIDKHLLKINPEYQREAITTKVTEITAEWSWVGCGALIVARREGEYWIIDGQHRALAARRRSDITTLPCIVFDTQDIKQEAIGFLDANTGRKPVSAIAKQHTLVAAGDETAQFVNQTLNSMGIKISRYTKRPREIKCIAWCMRRAAEDRQAFCAILQLVMEISETDGMPLPERLLEGLWVLNTKCGDGLNDKRLVKRLREKGARTLMDSINRAASFYAAGGGKVWAQGILAEVNKGLQKKFTLDGIEA